jgi:hypothetical protein
VRPSRELRPQKLLRQSGEEARMTQWVTAMPNGHELRVTRDGGTWIVRCGEDEARNDLLDVAMIEAIRGDAAVYAHSPGIEYGPWIRAQADRIERAFHSIADHADP